MAKDKKPTLIKRARKIKNLSYQNYVDAYGDSKATALAIIEEAAFPSEPSPPSPPRAFMTDSAPPQAATQLIEAARTKLGLSHNAYVAQYGRSKKTARAIIAN
jgi:DNA-binding transcriptional regulator YiaG